eukprot:m.42060 g.42060  ORF g.42060 m.42060 type:complete len:258 (+) comp14997_c0_seq2:334-1107(+)
MICAVFHMQQEFACLTIVISLFPSREKYCAPQILQRFITSKIPGCGVPTQGIPSRLHCYTDSMKAFGEDLQLLNTTYIDLVLIHFPPLGGCTSDNCPLMQEQWAVLEEVYKSKQARAIGVSNYCQECLECILKNATVTPAVNQVMHHVGMGPDPLKIRDFCAQHGIVVEAYSPLGSGSKELISGNLTTDIGKKYNKSSPEVAIKWIVQQGLPLATKASNPEYLREDIDMWSWNLTAADMQTLDAATKPFGAPSFMCF